MQRPAATAHEFCQVNVDESPQQQQQQQQQQHDQQRPSPSPGGPDPDHTSYDMVNNYNKPNINSYKRFATIGAICLSALVPCASVMCLPKIQARSIRDPSSYSYSSPSGQGHIGHGSSKMIKDRMREAVNARALKRILFNTENGRLFVYLVAAFVVTFSTKKLKKIYLFNLAPLWEWELFLIFLVGGFGVTRVMARLLVEFFKLFYAEEKYTFYYIKGLKRSFHFVFFSTSILLVNSIYFANPELNPHIKTGDVYKGIPLFHFFTSYVIQTSVAFFIASLLWMFKNTIILQLKAACVYERLEDKIVRDVILFWFLALIHEEYRDLSQLAESRGAVSYIFCNPRYDIDRLAEIARENIRNENKRPSPLKLLHKVQHQARYIIDLAENIKEREDNTDHILDTCNQRFSSIHPSGSTVSKSRKIHEDDLVHSFKMSPDEAKLFLQILAKDIDQDQDNRSIPDPEPPAAVTYETLEKWLVNANRTCLQLGYSLVDCRAAVSQLDRILVALVIFLSFLWWLIMTKNGTTKVLAIIAFPFTTGAFMFQDAGKDLFQGIMFTFVKHPFDVGDLCIIEGTKLEVKRSEITKTLFRIPGVTGAELYLDNSLLATKPIINLQRIPDTNDRLKIYLDISTPKTKVEELQKNIIKLLATENDPTKKNGEESVIVKEMEDCIKMIVHFKHDDTSMYEMAYSEFFHKKNTKRSKLILDIKGLTEELGITLFPHTKHSDPIQNLVVADVDTILL